MGTLELKVPPVALVLVIALAMWGTSFVSLDVELPLAVRAIAAVGFAVGGGSISIAGVMSFRQARTTVNPTSPESTSVLVSAGVYRVTRNPMYLGFLRREGTFSSVRS